MFCPSTRLMLSDNRRRSSSRSEEHTSELQSLRHLVCRLLLEKKKNKKIATILKQHQFRTQRKTTIYTHNPHTRQQTNQTLNPHNTHNQQPTHKKRPNPHRRTP